ncbi:response regulator [Ruminiclostridium herbifermentans]|uniref:Stage 0 sporulation protein A homolog n=1 Tax=Ruminiclostridium herbifermentans TaxID=2488810 RepID=A0A4U7JJL9_9FIRM|nr:response regulator [Ruminiclostridium herbifermentans]QNU66132.1 response regulator [Ruminiclostridium herbifermentans]
MRQKYKVLIVDDEEGIVAALKNNLALEGYMIDNALNAEDAYLKIKKDKYHIVLADIEMPEMDGIELLKQIKSYDALTQVIMMTGSSTMDKILRSLEFGANDYILKPFISVDYVIQIIDYSIQKLERWRDSIVQVVK